VKIRGLKLGEIVVSLCDPIIQETVFVSQGHTDVVACPAEVDTSTDDEEDTNSVTGTV